MNRSLLAGLAAAGLSATLAHADPEPVARAVLGLYDGTDEPDLRYVPLHSRVELPLNYLGLTLTLHDVREGLPPVEQMDGVRGVVTWFTDRATDDPEGYLAWAESVVDSGKRFVVLGALGVDGGQGPRVGERARRFWQRLGLEDADRWVGVTYDVEIVERDPELAGFERSLDALLPGYPVMRLAGARTSSVLTVERRGLPDTRSVLIATGPRGGYVAPGYVLYRQGRAVQWYVDPFELFRRALDTDALPKPDASTLSGRRIFYSHIDGDGWRNLSEITKYRKRSAIAAEVVLEEIVRAFPDFPVTVGPVVADLDPDWLGTEASLAAARALFAEPNVEAGSHSYSHPLDWTYFDPKSSEPSRQRGPAATEADTAVGGLLRRLGAALGLGYDESRALDVGLTYRSESYDRPRSYRVQPFSLERETAGSVQFIDRLLPAGKRVEIFQWSGDTSPFEAAIAATRRLGLRNINGGDSRFDADYPSYAWVAPLSRRVGRELQIYASNSNENTYTELWTDRFFGFKQLLTTISNTESPRRIKPFNVYYHMYSGEKLPSLIAVRANLEAARRQELAPVATSRYAAIVDGFHSTRLTALGERQWRVEDRDGVATLRFDAAEAEEVDWARSSGVVGQRHVGASLYVALDAAVAAPVVALRARSEHHDATSFLIEGRWEVSRLRRSRDGLSFRAEGFGPGEMRFRVLPDAAYRIVATGGGREVYRGLARSDAEGELRFVVEASAIEGVVVALTRARGVESP